MAQINAFILVTDAGKDDLIEAVAHLTPGYILGFSRAVVPISPTPTISTTATHWRANDASVEQSVPVLWQAVAADGALPEDYDLPEGATMTEQEIIDALDGVVVEISNDVPDSNAWAEAKLTPLGLRDRPTPEF